MISRVAELARSSVADASRAGKYRLVYRKFRDFTMVPSFMYVKNLLAIHTYSKVPGCVVECGTWKGGMIAGIADLLGPDRRYFLSTAT